MKYCMEWNNTKKSGVVGFSSLPDTLKSSLNVSRRVTKHQSWHPHSSSSLYTTAQAGRGPGSPKLKTPESSTLLVKPLKAETSNSTSDREATKPPPINSTHVKKCKEERKNGGKHHPKITNLKERSFGLSVVEVKCKTAYLTTYYVVNLF